MSKLSARCRMLAGLIPGFTDARVMRCPTGLYGTHYHAATPVYGAFGPVPCGHRHMAVNAAVRCAGRMRPACPASMPLR